MSNSNTLQEYRVYDTQSQVYGNPFLAMDNNQAKRRLMSQLIDNPGSDVFRYAEQFSLVATGLVHADTPLTEPFSAEVHVCSMNEVKQLVMAWLEAHPTIKDKDE